MFTSGLKSRALTQTVVRGIKLHEYQAAQLLKSYGVSVPSGHVAHTYRQAEEVADIMEKEGATRFVVKA
jgi:succinyl-CoA synthetase beta subunit